MELIERFNLRVNKNGPIAPGMDTPCWLWTGGTAMNGYGKLSLSKTRSTGAHAWSYKHFVGPVEEGQEVCHRCDVRRCVRPDHLFAGTRKQNMEDAQQKGRTYRGGANTYPRGESRWNAKLTEADIPVICADPRIADEIAADYGVTKAAIHAIKNRRTWAHVPVDVIVKQTRNRHGVTTLRMT